MTRVAILLVLFATIADAAVFTAAALSWPGAAERARDENREHVARFEAREGARCWDLAPGAASASAREAPRSPCDATVQLLEGLGTGGEASEAVRRSAIEAALACRCASSPRRGEAVVRLVGMPVPANREAWLGGGEASLLVLAARLARPQDLEALALRVHLLSQAAAETAPRESIVLLHEVQDIVREPRTRDRHLAMEAIELGLGAAMDGLGAIDLAAHDRAARALALPRLLDACEPRGSCEPALLATGHLRSDDVDAYDRRRDELVVEIGRAIRVIGERTRELERLREARIEVERRLRESGRVGQPLEIRRADVEVHGPLSPRAAYSLIRRHLGEVRVCNASEPTHAWLEGGVTLQLIVDTTGRVQASGIATTTTADPLVAGCITQAARSWSFPPESGGASFVTAPFTFEGRG